MLKTAEIFSLNKSLAGEYLINFEYPWQAVSGIRELILSLSVKLDMAEYTEIKENELTFKNTIKTNELIRILSKYEIDKLLIEEASLEDVFLHYYK